MDACFFFFHCFVVFDSFSGLICYLSVSFLFFYDSRRRGIKSLMEWKRFDACLQALGMWIRESVARMEFIHWVVYFEL